MKKCKQVTVKFEFISFFPSKRRKGFHKNFPFFDITYTCIVGTNLNLNKSLRYTGVIKENEKVCTVFIVVWKKENWKIYIYSSNRQDNRQFYEFYQREDKICLERPFANATDIVCGKFYSGKFVSNQSTYFGNIF